MDSQTNHAGSDDSDDDIPTLSHSALSALQEFYAERMEAERLLQQCTANVCDVQNVIPEDWVSELGCVDT